MIFFMLTRPNWRTSMVLPRYKMPFRHPLLPFFGRLFMVYVFATSGLAKIFSWQADVQYMSTRHLPIIPVLLAAAMVIEVGGSVCLITGYRAREAAFISILPKKSSRLRREGPN